MLKTLLKFFTSQRPSVDVTLIKLIYMLRTQDLKVGFDFSCCHDEGRSVEDYLKSKGLAFENILEDKSPFGRCYSITNTPENLRVREIER